MAIKAVTLVTAATITSCLRALKGMIMKFGLDPARVVGSATSASYENTVNRYVDDQEDDQHQRMRKRAVQALTASGWANNDFRAGFGATLVSPGGDAEITFSVRVRGQNATYRVTLKAV